MSVMKPTKRRPNTYFSILDSVSDKETTTSTILLNKQNLPLKPVKKVKGIYILSEVDLNHFCFK